MGAEEYGFGSIATIAEGCIMARVCHTNKCPVGVASQREDLRASTDRSFLIHGDIHTNGHVLDDEILADVDVRNAIDNQGVATKSYKVVNTDRSVGARISGAIALKYGDSAFEGQLTLNFQGAAGQSFGAFNHEGVSLNLTGESNDYVGKGINGGEITIET